MTKFIVISGKKQVGKTTLAEMLAEELESAYGDTVQMVSFADPVKRICNIAFGIPLNWMYGSDEDKNRQVNVKWDGFTVNIRYKYSNDEVLPRRGYMTVREVLQVIGTDIFRDMVSPNVWADAPFLTNYDADFVVIADCRFPNEMYKNGTLIRLKRDTGLIDQHDSENALDHIADTEFNFVYENNGSLEDLRMFAENIIENLPD
jgi:hypothetical protein